MKKKVKERSLKEKCEDMFGVLHISQDIGEGALRQLLTHTAKTQLPMPALAEDALKFFGSRVKDKHGPILLAIFCLVYSRILLDPSVGCVTVSEIKKGGKEK